MDTPYDTLSILGQALAHPTRLQILDLLSREEFCVCHLTALLGQRQAHVSQHLRVLREAGLVSDRRDGQMVFYRLSDGRAAAALSLLKDLSRALDAGITYPQPQEGPLADCPCPRCSLAAGGGNRGGESDSACC